MIRFVVYKDFFVVGWMWVRRKTDFLGEGCSDLGERCRGFEF